MNYFNYFTEIEDTFVRRRGRSLLLSPMDWALMDSWKQMGVPLHVALRGVEKAFDSYESKPRKRSVKTLFYCQEEVEAQYAEWLESQLGANGDGATDESAVEKEQDADARLPFPRASILEHLARARASLLKISVERKQKDKFSDVIARAAARLLELENDFARAARPDAETLEVDLTNLEKSLDEALVHSISQDELDKAREDTFEQLKPYRQRMEQATYQQTFDNLLMKRLREQNDVPRLSLFYI